jgi:hypothetical protein
MASKFGTISLVVCQLEDKRRIIRCQGKNGIYPTWQADPSKAGRPSHPAMIRVSGFDFRS